MMMISIGTETLVTQLVCEISRMQACCNLLHMTLVNVKTIT
jgi:hypothetical protein